MTAEWWELDRAYRKARCWRCTVTGGGTLPIYSDRDPGHDLLALRPLTFTCTHGHVTHALSCGRHLPGPTLLPLCAECEARQRVVRATVTVGTPWPDDPDRERMREEYLGALRGR